MLTRLPIGERMSVFDWLKHTGRLLVNQLQQSSANVADDETLANKFQIITSKKRKIILQGRGNITSVREEAV